MNRKKTQGLSIFFPCYNDKGTIGLLVEDAFKKSKSLTNDFEVIVVDDGSTDGSRELLKNLDKKYKKLKLLFHKKNRGLGAAVISGLKAASKDLIFYTEGDMQYHLDELPILWQLMGPEADFVNGIKIKRRDRLLRIIIGKFYSNFVRLAFLLPLYDTDCAYRLIRRSLVKKLNLKNVSGAINVELVKKAQRQGANFKQVSVQHYERIYGRSQFFRLDRILKTLSDLSFLWIELMLLDRGTN